MGQQERRCAVALARCAVEVEGYRDMVRRMMQHAWSAYHDRAWGADEVREARSSDRCGRVCPPGSESAGQREIPHLSNT